MRILAIRYYVGRLLVKFVGTRVVSNAVMEKFNEAKALAAVLFLASQDGQIDLYALLKTLYYADKNHLHEWGRTITGDDYVRMTYGPVPSKIYNKLKSVRHNSRYAKHLNRFLIFEGNNIKPLHAPDMNKLSESDVKALQESFDIRGRKSFPELHREAHDDKAFQQSKNWIMDEKDLAEKDSVLIQHITEVKRNEQFLENYRRLPVKDEEEPCKG